MVCMSSSRLYSGWVRKHHTTAIMSLLQNGGRALATVTALESFNWHGSEFEFFGGQMDWVTY